MVTFSHVVKHLTREGSLAEVRLSPGPPQHRCAEPTVALRSPVPHDTYTLNTKPHLLLSTSMEVSCGRWSKRKFSELTLIPLRMLSTVTCLNAGEGTTFTTSLLKRHNSTSVIVFCFGMINKADTYYNKLRSFGCAQPDPSSQQTHRRFLSALIPFCCTTGPTGPGDSRTSAKLCVYHKPTTSSVHDTY